MESNAAFRAFAGLVAQALGNGWQLVVGATDFEQRVPHIRQGDNGPEFWLSSTWAGKGRVYVGANYPKDAEGRESRPYFSTYSEHGTESPSITFADTKSPEQAAKDISRRFLPFFLPLWTKQQAVVNANNTYRTGRAAFAAEVATILGGEVKPAADGTAVVRLGYRERGISGIEALDHDNQTVNVALRGITLDQLKQLQGLFYID
jgi:hypothetical protein